MNRILIRDNESGKVREYGASQHDALLISNNGGCLTFENLQCGDGSLEDGHGGYSFVLEDGETPNESRLPDAKNGMAYANIGGFGKEVEVKTNADKIRAKTNWELAEFLYHVASGAAPFMAYQDDCVKCDYTDSCCISLIGEWLISEAGSEAK